MKNTCILMILISSIAFGAADRADSLLSNYFGKIESELSGLNDPGTVTNQDWIETKLVRPLTAVIARLERDNSLLDATSTQTALDNGGLVRAPAGTYSETQTYLSVKSNTLVLGDGASTIFKLSKNTASPVSQFLIDGDSNVVFMNCKFVYDTTNSASYAFEYDHNVTVANGARNIAFIGCTFESLGDGIYLSSNSPHDAWPENIIVANCFFKGDSLEAYDGPCSRNGVSIVHAKNVSIANCVFDGYSNPGGIDIEPNEDQWVSSVNINNCNFIQRYWGISIFAGGPGQFIKWVNINNCTFNRHVYPGNREALYINNGVDNLKSTLQGININNCTVSGAYSNMAENTAHINIRGLIDQLNISNCYLEDCNYYAINIGRSKNVTLSNIRIVDSASGMYFSGSLADSTSSIFSTSVPATVPVWLTGEGITPAIVTEGSSNYITASGGEVDKDEGFNLIMSTLDTTSLYCLEARMYVQYKSGTNGIYAISTVQDYDYPSDVVYPTPDSTKRWLRYWFQPSPSDTIQILNGGNGTCDVKIDSLVLWKTLPMEHYTVRNIDIVNPRTYGIRGFNIINSVIDNVNITRRYNYDEDIDKLESTYSYGLLFYSAYRTDFTNIRSWQAETADFYYERVNNCRLDLTGTKNVYTTDKTMGGNSFLSTQSFTIQLDSVTANMDTVVTIGECLGKGVIVGMTGNLTGKITAGSCIVSTATGGYYQAEVYARDYLRLDFTGDGGEDLETDSVNSYGIHYANRLAGGTAEFHGDARRGRNLIGVRVKTDASFATTRSAKLIVHVVYQ